MLLTMLEGGQVLELRAVESSWGTRLKGASEKQLGREQRSKLHIEAGAGSGHVRYVVLNRGVQLLLSVDRRNVTTARMSVSKARDVGSEGTVRKTSIAVGRLRGVAKSSPCIGSRASGDATRC